MIAVEYRCGCGECGEMIEYAAASPAADYPQQQYHIRCHGCGAGTFRYDSPQATETSWAGMDGHAIEYLREAAARCA